MFPEKKHGQSIGPVAMFTYGLIRCPNCDAYFFHEKDLQGHVQTHWRPAHNGGEWMPAEADPQTREILRNVGAINKEGWEYILIHEGQTIFRTRKQ